MCDLEYQCYGNEFIRNPPDLSILHVRQWLILKAGLINFSITKEEVTVTVVTQPTGNVGQVGVTLHLTILHIRFFLTQTCNNKALLPYTLIYIGG